MSAPSVEQPITTRLPSTARRSLAARLEQCAKPQPDLSLKIILQPPVLGAPDSDFLIYSRILTLYDPNAIEAQLGKHDLTRHYPFLAQFLRTGFLLGNFPTLTVTKIHKNSKTSEAKPNLLWGYINKEVLLGHFSGPYLQAKCKHILHGCFVSSPLVIVTTLTSKGATKNQVCRHLSKADADAGFPAVNDFIIKDDFPTHFGTVQSLADAVSAHLLNRIRGVTYPSPAAGQGVFWTSRRAVCQ
jgi:hypothetical protein